MIDHFPRVLALDFGTTRVGVAVSRGSLAEPLLILSQGEKIWTQLLQLCQENNIEMLVVGESEGEMAAQSRAFGVELSRRTGLPVEFWDETLSSKTVASRLSQLKKAKPGQHIDHYAAALILEEWLEARG